MLSSHIASVFLFFPQAKIYSTSKDPVDTQLHQTAQRVQDMGRLLMATEIRSMRTYWHVQEPGTLGIARVYPGEDFHHAYLLSCSNYLCAIFYAFQLSIFQFIFPYTYPGIFSIFIAEVYAPKVIGMMWSMLAQLQTWFGNEVWKSYGIQLMPITPASELRDGGTWLAEMLPSLNDSCAIDKGTVQHIHSALSIVLLFFDAYYFTLFFCHSWFSFFIRLLISLTSCLLLCFPN